MKRFLIEAKEKDGRNAGRITLIQVEWSGTLEGLEKIFFEVNGEHIEVVEIMETVRYFPERRPAKSPFLQWVVM